jgi:hypothetical protein
VIRISFVLSDTTFAALSRAADVEQRDLRQHAAWLITEGLQRSGFLPSENEVDPGGRAEVKDTETSRASEAVDLIISATAATSTDEGRHARK